MADIKQINNKLSRNQRLIYKILAANENKAVRKIAKDYRKLFRKLDRDLRKLYLKMARGKISIEEANKFNRLDNLLKRSTKSINKFYSGLNKDLNKYMVNTAKNSLYGFSWSVNNAVNVSLAFDLPNKLAIQIAKDSPFTQIAKNRLYNDGVARVRSVINQGLKQGKSYIKLSKDLSKQLGINYRQAERIVRTETHRIYEAAHAEEFQQTKDMGIDTYMVLRAVIDNRTRQQSLQVDGERSNEEGKFKYPDGNYYTPGDTGRPEWDVNDRERSVQVIEGFEPKERYIKNVGVVSEEEAQKIIQDRII